MSTNTFKNLSGKVYSGQQVLKRSPKTATMTAELFRDVAKVKNLRKRKINALAEDEMVDASVTDELVADHEWESMLHTFEPESDELSPGTGGAESDDLWERLSSTRWLKNASTRELDPEGFSDSQTTPSSETKA